jgi:hypothetical protein
VEEYGNEEDNSDDDPTKPYSGKLEKLGLGKLGNSKGQL